MGQAMSFGLTQHDVANLITDTNGMFRQEEIEGLYKRFRQLDRGHKGFLTADELDGIPELSINPLAKRVSAMYEGVNFKEFLVLLAPHTSRAPRELRLRQLFAVADVDGDGVVGAEDVELLLRYVAGGELSDEEVKSIITAAFQAEGLQPQDGLKYADFVRVLDGVDPSIKVEMPMAD